jgi:predicted ribosome quality control (RQC) complex YloA/Tae2 family protein
LVVLFAWKWIKMDLFVLKAIVQELDPILKEARIQRIIQPSPQTVHLVCSGKDRIAHRLIISADPDFPRVYLSEEEAQSPAEPPDFCQLLRKHLSSAKITRISVGEWERIVQITLERPNPGKLSQLFALIIEVMGRWSNIILVDARTGRIIDCIKHIDPERNQKRSLIRNQVYQLPQEQKKRRVDSVDRDAFGQMAHEDLGSEFDSGSISRWLVKSFLGISPQTAKEIVSRAQTPSQALAHWGNLWESLTDTVGAMAESRYSPSVVLDRKGIPLELSAMGYGAHVPEEVRTFQTMNQAAEFFHRGVVRRDRLQSAQETMAREIERHLLKLGKTREAIERDLELSEGAEEHRLKGELLLENLEHVPEKSPTFLGEREGVAVEIELDLRFSPSENAQRYFRRYKKLRRGSTFAFRRKADVEQEKLFLEGLAFDAEEAASEEDLDTVRIALRQSGYRKKGREKVPDGKGRRKGRRKSEEGQKRPYRQFASPKGWIIFIGKSAIGNEFLVRQIGRPGDYWFHAQGMPGSHVLLRMPERSGPEGPPDEAIHQAAVLAAHFSRGKTNLKTSVDYLPFQKIKRPRGARPGQVIFTGQKSMVVPLEEAASLLESLGELKLN